MSGVAAVAVRVPRRVRERAVGVAAGTVLGALLLAGCTSDDGPDATTDRAAAATGAVRAELAALLLTARDVPSSVSDGEAALPRSLSCGAAVGSEASMESLSQGRLAATSLVLDGTTVDSAVFDLGTAFQRGLVFDDGVVTGVPRCIANASGFGLGPDGRTTVRNAALPGLAPGAAGYAGTLRGEDGSVRVEQRAYAAVGDRVVVVGARRDDARPLGVSVAALLATAVARVEAAAP